MDSRSNAGVLALVVVLTVPVMGVASSDIWMFEENEHLMTGRTYAVANSPAVRPISKPNFPYQDVSSRIDFVCSLFGEQVQFRFTALNIPTRRLSKIGFTRYWVTYAK